MLWPSVQHPLSLCLMDPVRSHHTVLGGADSPQSLLMLNLNPLFLLNDGIS